MKGANTSSTNDKTDNLSSHPTNYSIGTDSTQNPEYSSENTPLLGGSAEDDITKTSSLLVSNTKTSQSPWQTSPTTIRTVNVARRLMYISHFFAKFSETAWQFALVLFLAAFVQYKSLLLISTYGVTSNLALCMFSSSTGKIIDTYRHERLKVAQFFIWTENICVILGSVLCYLLLVRSENNRVKSSPVSGLPTDLISILQLIGIHLFGPMANILDGGFTVAIERDWVVELGQVALKATSSLGTTNTSTSSELPISNDRNQANHSIESQLAMVPELTRNYVQAQKGDESRIEIESGTNVAANKTNTHAKAKFSSATKKTDNAWLTETNVVMKQIDLSCKVLSPAIAGFAVDAFGSGRLSLGALWIGIINIASLVAEYICTAEIHRIVPELSFSISESNSSSSKTPKVNFTNAEQAMLPQKQHHHHVECRSNIKLRNNGYNHVPYTDETDDTNGSEIDRLSKMNSSKADIHEELGRDKQNQHWQISSENDFNHLRHTQSQQNGCCGDICWYFCGLFQRSYTSNISNIIPPSLIIYFQQPVSYAGFGSALLYLNTLTFGGIMMSYLLYRGMGISAVGMWRGISAAIGLLGTIVYPLSTKRFSLVTTGMWSLVFQYTCITASIASMFVSDYRTSMALMIAGVCTSRVGLHVYKITATQLMQQYIPTKIRGIVGGTQNSLNAMFELSAFALCLVFSRPTDFVYVVAAGYVAVGLALVLYAFGIYFRSTETLSMISSYDED